MKPEVLLLVRVIQRVKPGHSSAPTAGHRVRGLGQKDLSCLALFARDIIRAQGSEWLCCRWFLLLSASIPGRRSSAL